MEKNELVNVFAYAEVLWASTFKRQSDENKAKVEIALWYEYLKPYPTNVIYASMRELAKNSDFCNISKVAKGCQEIYTLTNCKTEDEIFAEIDNAISMYWAEENFENLSQTAKNVVISPKNLVMWAMSEIEHYNTVITSNIKRSIRNELQRENKIQSIGVSTLKTLQDDIKLLK